MVRFADPLRRHGAILRSARRSPTAYTVIQPMHTAATRPWEADNFAFPAMIHRHTSSEPDVQACLRLGAPMSPLEREADSIAQRTVRAEPMVGTLTATSGTECDADKKHQTAGKRGESDEEVLGKFTSEAAPMTPDTDTRIRSLPGQGAPLPDSERAFFEPRLGHSFREVRVHTDSEAGEAARDIGARAFTYRTNVVFAPGEYAPETQAGRQLLAHELVHVAQQSRLTPPLVQRDLATPEPAVPPAAQPALTTGQVQAALSFNRARYDQARTRLIQELVGSTSTGIWTEDDILMIAELQEDYGLMKDGMVGPVTFRFLDEEVRREKAPHTDANCLLAFQVRNFGVVDGGLVGGFRNIQGHFEVDARFSRTCGCANYEYRQFVRGHAIRRPAGGGPPVDLGPLFRQPGGLTAAFAEDGDKTDPVVNYGHRADAAEASPVNRYVDDMGAVDQAAGCHYQSLDFLGGPFPCAPGDELDIDINFRGEIHRGAHVVETKTWSGIHGVYH